jgi:AAA+ superfamily predicted ATPase
MRTSFTSLTGTKLCFDRSGQHLVVVEPDAVSVTTVARAQTRRIDQRDTRAVAAFEDQLWLVTHDDQLVRFDHHGRQLGTFTQLPFAAPGVLVPAPCGATAALWSSTPSISIIDDFGQLAISELPEADTIMPLTGRRHVVARGARLTLPSGIVTQLAPGSLVLGGAVMADGKAVTLLVAHAGGRQLVMVSLGTGQLAQRCALPAAAVRLATRRRVVIALVDPRVVWAFDLHGGRELGMIRLDRDVEDLAIDPDGTRVALRADDGTIEVPLLSELIGNKPTSVVRDPDVRDPAVQAPDVQDSGVQDSDVQPPDIQSPAVPPPDVEALPASEPCETTFTCPPLLALEPRRAPPVQDPAEMRAHLDRELKSVALWTLGAIAGAWDSRRVGYGNEGRHPFELEVAAILGFNRGHAAEYVDAARERLAEHDGTLAGDPRWRAPGTPIGTLIDELGLSQRAADILIVIAAAALWGETARLYGILANDPGRPQIDELIVQQVLAGRHGRNEVAAELDPRAPLVRLGIVQPAGKRARPFDELAIDPVVLDRLRAWPPALGDAMSVRTAVRPLDELELPATVRSTAVAALARPANGPLRLMVRGRDGSGRKTLLAALAGEAGRQVVVIDAHALPRTAEAFVAELRRSFRRAQLVGLLPCIVHLDEVTFGEHAARELASEAFRLHPGPIAVVASPDAPAAFPAGYVAIEVPVLAETARRVLWRRALADAHLVADVDALAARYRIGAAAILRAVESAAGDSAPTGDATPRLDTYVRQTRDARLGQYARRVERLASWSSVVLPPDILDSLRELVGRVRHGRTVFELWGMAGTMQTSRGLTALFQGAPGTGKTLVAGVIARELGLELYQVDLSKVMSKWIGETERNLATIFDAAEDGQVVLLFDEADSLFAKRTEVRSSNDRYANLEVNYLLQRLDAFEGIAILTTNNGTSIDQAFKRRMSFRLSFPFPDEDTREQLWRAHLPPELPVAGPLTLDVLARKYQLSGGYIRNACLRAAFLAAQEETVLHQRHLERAVALEFAELGKLSSSGAID